MNIFDVIRKVEMSKEFKTFKKENPGAYFCAAFFIMDYETNEHKKQLDYYVSSTDVMTFSIDPKDESKIIPAKAELPKKEKIPAIGLQAVKLNEDEIMEIAKKESEIGDFTKVIVVLQNLEGKDIWNLSCMKGLQMMRYHLSATDGKVLKKEKINLMDMMKIERGKTPDYIQ